MQTSNRGNGLSGFAMILVLAGWVFICYPRESTVDQYFSIEIGKGRIVNEARQYARQSTPVLLKNLSAFRARIVGTNAC